MYSNFQIKNKKSFQALILMNLFLKQLKGINITKIKYKFSFEFSDSNETDYNEWYVYDSLNDPNNALACAVFLEKIYIDMTGFRVKLVKVQQQMGNENGGVFACVFAELLAKRKDPSQFVFHQGIIRDVTKTKKTFVFLKLL